MPSEAPEDILVVYSDYVCPFCYLGKASLEEALDRLEDPPEVEWRPFDLRRHKRRPDGSINHSVRDGKDEAYYERARRNVERLAEAYDVEMTMDIAEDVDSMLAHRVALAIERDEGDEAFQAYHDAVFEALWKDGRDIGDAEVLRDVLASIDLDPAIVDEAIVDEALADTLDERLTSAHRAGVTGVPTFAYGRYAVPGALPPEKLEAFLSGDGG